MSEFTWSDRYKIGNDLVDSQHQHIFKLANETVSVSDDADITRLLMLFYQHVREHFQAEERLMKQAGYPRYQEHVEEHNLMLDRLNEISLNVQKRQWNPDDIKMFVRRWISVHIVQEDMRVGEYLKTHDA
ncbi:bacteriohemerythrin [Methylomonas rapida]|uniref:Bacteriohemerythrin n=1 Tax=Methylomonas rapida TaxID=2963939 RepID=A0ABY7GQR1_9GAMM|nr:bacteriohemerythrin [Methylomonas rapida]WAR46855.1 bacteriohemerythrin [Methylomonas rapida]